MTKQMLKYLKRKHYILKSFLLKYMKSVPLKYANKFAKPVISFSTNNATKF